MYMKYTILQCNLMWIKIAYQVLGTWHRHLQMVSWKWMSKAFFIITRSSILRCFPLAPRNRIITDAFLHWASHKPIVNSHDAHCQLSRCPLSTLMMPIVHSLAVSCKWTGINAQWRFSVNVLPKSLSAIQPISQLQWPLFHYRCISSPPNYLKRHDL